MNYGWARDFVLQLINQYSIAGDGVALTYNNQADYVARIPKLLDSAQMLLATTVRRIRVTVPLDDLACRDEGEWAIYQIPRNCWQLSGDGLIRFRGDRVERFHRYYKLGAKELAVREKDAEGLYLEYFRLPEPLGGNPSAQAELDNDPEVQLALPYYAAAHLVLHDNPFAYSALMNEFEDRKNNLVELQQTEFHAIEDAYRAENWGCVE